MAQSKRDKQIKTLTHLLQELEHERVQRASLQCQAFGLIAPNETESRLSREAYTLKVRLGMLQDVKAIF